jgi:hypothetical protein
MASSPLIDRVPTGLAGATQDFAWPDFDRWQATFAAAGIFPPRWEGLERAPTAHAQDAERYRLRKLVLYCEWLDMLAHRSVVLAHYARQGIRARIARQDQRPACPACDPFHGCEVGRELDAIPPFHPGCRCVLVASPSERPRARMRRAQGVGSRSSAMQH